MKTLIKNARLYYQGQLTPADLLIENGRFTQIAEEISTVGVQVLDAKKQLVTPGLVDVHVHFREPGQVHKETIKTGTQASAHGGFTTVGAMPNVTPVPDNAEKFQKQLNLNQKNSLINTLQYAPVTKGETSDELVDIEALFKLGAFAFSNDGHGIMNAQSMFSAMERISAINSHLAAHVEDKNLFNHGVINFGSASQRLGLPGIKQVAETSQLARDLVLAKETGVHYHVCHISTKDGVQLVRMAKDAGINVTCEVTPHHLLFNDEDILTDDANFKMNPPLRSQMDQRALLDGLADGTIDMIATDHAPHAQEEKNQGFEKSAFGITGIETSFPLMYTRLVKTGLISLEKLIDLMSTKPAQIFGLNNAGTITLNQKADFTIIDLDQDFTIAKADFLSKGKNSPFIGQSVFGKVEATYVNGKPVYTNECEE
ncbi:dihydroorotase [Companilactobacillus alimentarius]|uniref:Dihydroorotase n=1 Tax=Companilactobacillus alimentarius DSM 20249 TaxID=1423720 RepID=A0A2K9HF77_9LACO|nr:dihydroorotase [Companilactobacillus alimentarius]AUI71028.1 dihydroorotase [Companilactobacillus alimentarius DSM 20249]KRK75142.1 dihydroorotase [Companilactobacillus alimentarius DSM 20249]GEO44082.1 dihydroorotase [Companilactobacillus alimentarius]